jgi:hypothetical protein
VNRRLENFLAISIGLVGIFIASCSSDFKKKASDTPANTPKLATQRTSVVITEQGYESYFNAVKKLQARVLLEQTRIIGTPTYSAKQALWLKLKKQLVNKELYKKAIIKNEELVVKTSDVVALSRKLVARVNDLVHPTNKKNRIISIGYAESKIRDILRKAGYRHPDHVRTITRNVLRELKIAKQTRRIPLSTLEEITAKCMKNFKRSGALQESMSRLAAEVVFLKAIKTAKLTPAQEIDATNRITDALSKITSREQLTHNVVKELIAQTIDDVKNPNKKKSKKSRETPAPKKDKKRGQKVRSGRWGKPREQ